MRILAVLLAGLLPFGCTATPPPASAAACGSPVSTDALPTWARTGFSWDGSGMQHVFGARGEIVAILFGAPLRSPSPPDHGNKILWVSRQPVELGDRLEISGVLAGTGLRAAQTVQGGPGPSIVDLPKPGCWRFTLSWSGRTDTLDLVYAP
ncbi:hypothetical protein HH310_11790 [Actinoplanes sp. TBRC 11911]|uniref:hypothetical protein n=1 Tax=Actinoplanes sp. TBRC 11911 TaxID=2729386 RepID=UPI00145FBA6E|nr:hypothetical protein [Actinoplanes sp. TBRC 11911]NMO51872.1 hypothetical protein [Actinoplanes sp. TBRC 11911]